MKRGIWKIAVGMLLFWVGCARYPANPPLHRVDTSQGYRFNNVISSAPHKDDFVIVTFSGGGMRASALAYGVLAHLNETRIRNNRTLLDDVDVISAVSGGSFTAAYYGLFGKERFFQRFRQEVLYRDIETQILLRLLLPWNWFRLASPYFGRSDLVDEYYDSTIFEGRTFADLPMRPPFILINTTDMSQHAQFSFIQDHFDRLCSDLSSVHISRAVASSSAFGVYFTPLTFNNYPKSECGYVRPDWVTRDLHDLDKDPIGYDWARKWFSYENAERRPFIHFIDGGESDDLGLRGPELGIITENAPLSVLHMIDIGMIKRLAVIVVDAARTIPPVEDRSARPPDTLATLVADAISPMRDYTNVTLAILRDLFARWSQSDADFDRSRRKCEELANQLCLNTNPESKCADDHRDECYRRFEVTDKDRPPYPAFYEIEIRLDLIKDPALRRRLAEKPDSLQLPSKDVDELIKEAANILDQSPAYNKLVSDLQK